MVDRWAFSLEFFCLHILIYLRLSIIVFYTILAFNFKIQSNWTQYPNLYISFDFALRALFRHAMSVCHSVSVRMSFCHGCTETIKHILTVFTIISLLMDCLGGAVGIASQYAIRRSRSRCLATVISESGFEAQPGPIIVSGYSGVCFEIKFSGRHRGFDGVLFNLWPLANTGFRDAQY